MLVVLHDLNLAARYCDRLVLLDEGRVRAEGVPRAVLADAALAEAYGVGVDLVEDQAGIWVHLSSV